ncbi:unnamed protein product, partial [Allacma fusca]
MLRAVFLKSGHPSRRLLRAVMSDDITALLVGFGRFNLNRRRLSVICDEDDGIVKQRRSELSEDLRNVVEYKRKGMRVSPIIVEKSIKDLCMTYNDAEPEDKFKFLEDLARNFATDKGSVNEAASSLLSCDDDKDRFKLEEQLRSCLIPDYHWVFLQIGKLDNGVKFLVDLRSDIIDLSRNNKSENIRTMNDNLRELISLWFAIGFLRLERVTWGSSCDMLQKISEYEAVHPMRNWSDLKRRVGPYRRCFVFTHGSMPREPVVVLHVFLTQSIPGKIATIVKSSQMMSIDSNNDVEHTVEDANLCDTAIFYSITSTQKGLLGIELGNFLIKCVVKELKSEFPKMKRFSSLSPIPGFKKWLISSICNGTKVLTQEEEDELQELLKVSAADINPKFLNILETDEYSTNEVLRQKMEKVLMRLCATYLAVIK